MVRLFRLLFLGCFAALAAFGGGNITVLPATLPDGLVGSTIGTTAPNPPSFSVQLIDFTAQGAHGMVQFRVSSGSLPPGVSLSSSGALRGEPTRTGQFSFTIEARDGTGTTGTRSYSIAVLGTISGIFTGQVGESFDRDFNCFATPPEPFTYTLTGNLPPGIVFVSDVDGSAFLGVPTAPADRVVRWRCSSALFTASINFRIIIEDQPHLSFTGPVGVPVDIPFSIPGGTAPFSYAVTQGMLPPGVMLSMNEARLTGAPTTAGTYDFVVTKTDFDDLVTSVSITFVVPGLAFQLSQTQLTLDAVSDGPIVNGSVTISGGLGAAYASTVMTDVSPPWLSVSPATGAVPQVLRIDANPAGLSPGTYMGTVDVGPPGGMTSRLTVTLRVSAAQPADLSISPSGLQFAFVTGAPAETKTVQLSNAGSGNLPVDLLPRTDDGAGWLSVTPRSAVVRPSAPVIAQITADPAGLPPGTYSGHVSAATAADAPADLIPVTMTIADRPGVLRLSRNGLNFQTATGGRPSPQTVRVFNDGVGDIVWAASASTVTGGDWLRVSGGAGRTPSSFNVSVDAAGLAAGLYYGRIRVTAAEAVNSPQTVIVALQVVDQATVGPQPNSRGGLIVVRRGASAGTSLTFQISNPTPIQQPLTVQLSALGFTLPTFTIDDLLNVVVPSQINSQSAVDLTLEATTTLGIIPAGVYRGRVQLGFDSGPPAAIDLALVVTPGSTSPFTPLSPEIPAAFSAGDGQVSGANCNPSSIAVVNTAPGQGFQATLGQSTPVEALAVNDCGELVSDAEVTAFFSNGDTAVNLASNGDGSYSGDWNPQDDRENAQVTVDARQRGINGTVEVGGSLTALAGIPSINSGGAVSAASFSAQSPLPPGAFVSVFGSNLAAQTEVATALPFPTEIGGVSLQIAGQAVPLQFVASGQINAVLPFGLDINAAQQVVVQRGPALSAPESVSVSAAQPAVFTQDLTGTGPAAAVGVRPNGTSFLVGPEGSLQPGDVVLIFCAGLGEVNPPVTAGTAAPGNPLATTVNPVTVTIGGVPAQVVFSGLAPGFAGLYQINAVVPSGVTSGAQAVAVTVSGRTSPPVTLAVQ